MRSRAGGESPGANSRIPDGLGESPLSAGSRLR